MTKRALIFGVSGMDGSHLADLLLAEGLHVHGVHRHTSLGNLTRIEHLASHPRFTLHRGDLTDVGSLYQIVSEVAPSWIFNEADQDNVDWSRSLPGLAARVTFAAVADLLEIVRQVVPQCRFFQPCSSTMFGNAAAPQNEATTFDPQSPYACAKAAAYYLVRHYRQQHGLFAVNGILFNHTSPRQTEEYLLRKICSGVVRIKRGELSRLRLGNLETRVDIGYAGDYMRAAWLSLQADSPTDYVIGTGVAWTIEEIVRCALHVAGLPGTVADYVETAEEFWRPTTETRAAPNKAKWVLRWEPEVGIEGLIRMLIEAEEGKSLETCDHCGKRAKCQLTCDPFIEDVHNRKTEESWWCNDCHRAAIREI